MALTYLNKDYISNKNGKGVFHFRSLLEGNNNGDFGNYFDIREVDEIYKPNMTSADVYSKARDMLSGENNTFCLGEYHLISGSSEISGSFSGYQYNPESFIVGGYLTFFGDNSSNITFILDEGEGGSFNSGDSLKGYIRINDTLLLTKDTKTFITSGGTVYSKTIEEGYSEE